ncbi:MAG: hypothetical protein MI861_01215, partial [Pirellulales bacterium]|nr:hypothetical protein [Pirellulales bacterium]
PTVIKMKPLLDLEEVAEPALYDLFKVGRHLLSFIQPRMRCAIRGYPLAIPPGIEEIDTTFLAAL